MSMYLERNVDNKDLARELVNSMIDLEEVDEDVATEMVADIESELKTLSSRRDCTFSISEHSIFLYDILCHLYEQDMLNVD